MAVKFSPWGNQQFVTSAGVPASGYKLFAYAGGSVNTKQSTYTDSTGAVAQSNPIILDSNGWPTSGSIWLTVGLNYKFVLAPSTDTDPPTSPVKTIDVIAGVNDATTSIDQWIAGATPTYISATSLSLVGDQTSTYHVGRRLKCTVTAGTVYATITASAYTTLTTLTVTVDSGTLDSGLSAISYGLVSKTNDSLPRGIFPAIADVRGFTNGLTISNNALDANNDIDISAGAAVDTTFASVMRLSSSITKRLDASWAVGTNQGGLDTGSEANSTWYYLWLIMRSDTGVVDVLFSASATAPTMPANYDRKRRLRGAIFNNSSGNINPFLQNGTLYLHLTDIVNASPASVGTSASDITVSVPPGIPTDALLHCAMSHATGGNGVLLSSKSATDQTPGVPKLSMVNESNNGFDAADLRVYVPTSSAAVRARATAASTNVYVSTYGFVDRGED